MFELQGYAIMPRAGYLARAEDFEDFRARFDEATALRTRIGALRVQLVEAYQAERKLELAMHRAKSRYRKAEEWTAAPTKAKDEALALWEQYSEEHDEQRETSARLEEEFEKLARHVRKNFVALQVDKEVPNVTPPRKDRVKDEVGQPMEEVW